MNNFHEGIVIKVVLYEQCPARILLSDYVRSTRYITRLVGVKRVIFPYARNCECEYNPSPSTCSFPENVPDPERSVLDGPPHQENP